MAALRVLAGLLEASAEGMDAFRVRDGFNVLYHALAQGHDALQQVKEPNRVKASRAEQELSFMFLWGTGKEQMKDERREGGVVFLAMLRRFLGISFLVFWSCLFFDDAPVPFPRRSLLRRRGK